MIYNSFEGTFFAEPTKIANAIIFGPQYKTPFLQTIPMNKIKNIVFSALLTIGAFAAVTFNSCKSDDSPVDPCAAIVCQNGGSCNNGSCSCPSGFEGALCETQIRTKFVGNWNASDRTGTQTVVYTVSLANGSNPSDVLIARSFSDGFFNNSIAATVSNQSGGVSVITIADQRPDANSDYRVSGTGTYASGTITWSYVITEISSGRTQTYTGTWTR